MKPAALLAVLGFASAGCTGISERQVATQEAPVRNVPGLCLSGEQQVFGCDIAGGVAGVCLSDGKVHVRIRRRQPGDLSASSNADWSNVHTFVNRSQGGLNQDRVRITEGSRHYVVYWGETGSLSESPGTIFAGAAVLDDSAPREKIANYACKPGSESGLRPISSIEGQAPANWDGEEYSDGPFSGIF